VILRGLEAFPWLNGSAGLVENHEPSDDRYTVRMDSDGTAKTVAGANMKPYKPADWTHAYSRWLAGVSEEMAAAMEAATEVTTVLVPGFVLPKPVKEKPKWTVPLRYLLLASFLLIISQLIFLEPPFAQIMSLLAAGSCLSLLCSSWSRFVKLAVLTTACFGTGFLTLKLRKVDLLQTSSER